MNDMRGIASILASQGRNGDSTLVHMAPEEVSIIDELGFLTQNPSTGLPEAFSFKDFMTGLFRVALTGVGTAIGGPAGGFVAGQLGSKLGPQSETADAVEAGFNIASSVAGPKVKGSGGMSNTDGAALAAEQVAAIGPGHAPMVDVEWLRAQDAPAFEKVVSAAAPDGGGDGGFWGGLEDLLTDPRMMSFVYPQIANLLSRDDDSRRSRYDDIRADAQDRFDARFGDTRLAGVPTFADGGIVGADRYYGNSQSIGAPNIGDLLDKTPWERALAGSYVGAVSVDPRYQAGFMPEAQYFSNAFIDPTTGQPTQYLENANEYLKPFLGGRMSSGNPFNTSATDSIVGQEYEDAYEDMMGSFGGRPGSVSPAPAESDTQSAVRNSDAYAGLLEGIFGAEQAAAMRAREALPYNPASPSPWSPTDTPMPPDSIDPAQPPSFPWDAPTPFGPVQTTGFGGGTVATETPYHVPKNPNSQPTVATETPYHVPKNPNSQPPVVPTSPSIDPTLPPNPDIAPTSEEDFIRRLRAYASNPNTSSFDDMYYDFLGYQNELVPDEYTSYATDLFETALFDPDSDFYLGNREDFTGDQIDNLESFYEQYIGDGSLRKESASEYDISWAPNIDLEMLDRARRALKYSQSDDFDPNSDFWNTNAGNIGQIMRAAASGAGLSNVELTGMPDGSYAVRVGGVPRVFNTIEEGLDIIKDMSEADANTMFDPFNGVNEGYMGGGMVPYAGGGLISGPGGGMDDLVSAIVSDSGEPIRVGSGEFIIPADVVSMLGDGDTNHGANRLHEMMDKVRISKTGSADQAPPVDPNSVMPR